MNWQIYKKLGELVFHEFSDIVIDQEIVLLFPDKPNKLRLFLKDKSFVDIWLSGKGRYSYHWNLVSQVYRQDNAFHGKWRHIKTFPKHFHNGREDNVIESHISDNPEEGLRDFLKFVREKLKIHD